MRKLKSSLLPSKRRKIAFIVFSVFFALLIALFISEIILRCFNPVGLRERASWHFLLWDCMQASRNEELVWEHKPGAQKDLIGYHVRINRSGFRGRELRRGSPDEFWRLLALGDSMTFGMSGSEADSYPAQLESMIESSYSEISPEIVNAGVLGYTTLQEEALLKPIFPI